MSSVVNKSKNKFAPKATVRPRPRTATAAPAAAPQPATNTVLQSPSKPQQPRAESQLRVAPEPDIRQEQGPTIAPQAGQHDEVLVGSPELQRSRVITVPALRTARAPGKQSLRHTSTEGSSSRSAGIPATQPTSDRRIPRLRSATAEIPSIRSSSSEGGLSDGVGRQTKNKGKAVMRIGPHGSDGLNVQGLTRGSNEESRSTAGGGEEPRETQTDNCTEGVTETEPPVTGNVVQSQARKRRSKKQPTDGPPKRPAKKRKVTTRPRRTGAGSVNAEEEEVEPTTDPAEQTSGEEEACSEGSESEEQPISVPRKPRRPKKARATAKPGGRRKPSGRRREESPEDGEEQEISPSVTKMKELCKDIKIGRKSKRFVELQQMNWKQTSGDQRGTNPPPGGRRATGEDNQQETTEERLERLSNERQSNSRVGAPQMRIANGELVLDQESIQVNSHDRDAIDEGAMEVVEENMAYRRVTSATWGRHRKVEKWDIAETQRFYTALSMFGTDFEIMSRMFPARTRKQMRSKFISEERKHPEKITTALRTRVPINVDEYSQMADMEIGDPQLINDELEKIRELHEADEQAALGHAAEMERERQENANAAMRAGDNATAVADQSKKGKKKKGAKDRSTVAQGVEEVLSMSREEYEAERLRELAEADEI